MAMQIHRSRLIQLKGLISSEAGTLNLLQFTDRLLQNLPHQDGNSLKIQELTKELQKTKKMLKELQKDKKGLEEVVKNMKIDLQTMTIKSQKRVARIQELQYERSRQERRERKREKRRTKQMEAQCDALPSIMFDEIRELYQKAQIQKLDLRLLLTQALNDIQQREISEITDQEENDDKSLDGDLECYYSDDESQIEEPIISVSEGKFKPQMSTPVLADGLDTPSKNIHGQLSKKTSQLVSLPQNHK